MDQRDPGMSAEFEAALSDFFRQRFTLWVGLWLGFNILLLTAIGIGLAWEVIVGLPAGLTIQTDAVTLIERTVVTAILALGLWLGATRLTGRAELIRLVFWIIIAVATVTVMTRFLPRAFGIASGVDQAPGFLLSVFSHFLACLVLPWSPLQAAQPAIALWLIWAVATLLFAEQVTIGTLIGNGLIGAFFLGMGLLFCRWRHRSFGQRFETGVLSRLDEGFQRELFDAQAIHAAIFPAPVLDGPIRFNFLDRPRSGIGGDYLHAATLPDGSLNLVVLDVTGDGIAAALTVNRIHGELERLSAEGLADRPGEAIEALNHYADLTLAPHGVFAVAMCFRMTPGGTLEWAGAGHLPAFVVRCGGGVEQLESTSWTLGAEPGCTADHATRHTRLGPGDVLLAVSDGAVSEVNADNRVLGFRGLRRIIESMPAHPARRWPQELLRRLDAFRDTDRPPGQDLLIVAAEIAPVSVASDARPRTPVPAGATP